MPTKEQVEKMLELLGQASRDDLDELLHDLLEKTHPTETAQKN